MPHGHKQALSPLYPKKYFLYKMNVRHPVVVLNSFSIKNSFYDKMDLRLFLFSCDEMCYNITCINTNFHESFQYVNEK